MLRIVHRFTLWFGAEWPVTSTAASGMRLHTLVGGLLAIPIYSVFALTNLLAYGAMTMALVTGFAAFVALCSLLLLRHTKSNSIPGHCFTMALAIQVFGEMALNGGLQAPAAALSLLIVPAAIFTAGASAVLVWAIVTFIAISSISLLDFGGLLPVNELPASAKQFDQMFSLTAGILITSVVVYLFQRQANQAIATLSEERASFRHTALHDALTGIPNRRNFYEYVNDSLNAALSNNESLTLFYFDIDRFKQINDHYGHAIGDELLKAFALRLNNTVKNQDLAARLSGDEFALLADTSNTTIEDYIARLRSITDEPFSLSGINHDIGISIGFARLPDDGQELETLLNVADQRMYLDKSNRRKAANNVIGLISDIDRVQCGNIQPQLQRKVG